MIIKDMDVDAGRFEARRGGSHFVARCVRDFYRAAIGAVALKRIVCGRLGIWVKAMRTNHHHGARCLQGADMHSFRTVSGE